MTRARPATRLLRARARALPMAAALLALALWSVPQPVAADPGETQLSVSLPVSARIGDEVAIDVLATDGDGQPIAGARVTLSERIAFLDQAANDAEVTGGVTGGDGVARLRYKARREGDREISLRYDGDRTHAAATVSLTLAVAPGSQTYVVQTPARVPGVNRFMVALVLAAVWGTMLFVSLHVVAIAREGWRDGGGETGP